MNSAAPVIERHDRFDVVRDDLIEGGTKARYLGALFNDAHELVYASPAQGAAQIALAVVAKSLKKRATIFVAQRADLHPNSAIAKKNGALIKQIEPGYFSVVSARAKAYAEKKKGVKHVRALAPFGLRIPQAQQCIREMCLPIAENYDEVWCAAGSGTLAEALSIAFPFARIFAVSVGHKIQPGEAGRAKVLRYDRDFDRPARVTPPFPCNSTFDAKAWGDDDDSVDWQARAVLECGSRSQVSTGDLFGDAPPAAPVKPAAKSAEEQAREDEAFRAKHRRRFLALRAIAAESDEMCGKCRCGTAAVHGGYDLGFVRCSHMRPIVMRASVSGCAFLPSRFVRVATGTKSD